MPYRAGSSGGTGRASSASRTGPDETRPGTPSTTPRRSALSKRSSAARAASHSLQSAASSRRVELPETRQRLGQVPGEPAAQRVAVRRRRRRLELRARGIEREWRTHPLGMSSRQHARARIGRLRRTPHVGGQGDVLEERRAERGVIASRHAGREPRPPRPDAGRLPIAQMAQPLRQRSRVIGRRPPREAVEEQRLDGPGALPGVGEVVTGHPLHQVRRPIAVRPERLRRRLADHDGPLRQVGRGIGRRDHDLDAYLRRETQRRPHHAAPALIRPFRPAETIEVLVIDRHAHPAHANLGRRRIRDTGRPSPAGMRLGHASRPTHPDPPQSPAAGGRAGRAVRRRPPRDTGRAATPR